MARFPQLALVAILVGACGHAASRPPAAATPSAHPGVARLSLHLPDAMRPRAAAAPLSPAAASKASLDGGGGDAIEFRYYQVDQVRVRVRVRVG